MIGATLPLLVFAYVQSIAFALNSRSRNRSSPIYHFVANVLAAVIFFWMLDRLIKSELSLEIIPAYVVGTVLGSLTGAKVAIWIEQKIGAIANIPAGSVAAELSGRSLFVQGLPIIGPFLVLAVYLIIQPPISALVFGTLAFFLFFDSFAHTFASRAGNRNKPMLILGAALAKSTVTFFIYRWFITYDMGWPLFIPYVVGSIIGSISSMLISVRIERKTGASTDAHVNSVGAPKLILWPIALLLPLALAESLFFAEMTFSLLFIYGLALMQNFSFLLVSRARNRNKAVWHALAAVFSNGIWFLTFRELYLAGLEWPFVIPYMLGAASGSLIAYNISILIERKTGAVADAPKSQGAR